MVKTAYGSHTQFTSTGTGDSYGVGKKQPLAKIRRWSMNDNVPPPTKKQLKSKPKALA